MSTRSPPHDAASGEIGAYRFRDHRVDAIRVNLDQVYGSNTVQFDPLHGIKKVPTERIGREFGAIGYSRSQFAAPVKVYVERDFGETFIIQFISSKNTFQGERDLITAGTGSVVPARQIVGGDGLAYQSVHLSTAKIHEWCCWWWGQLLPAPLRLHAQPFSPELSSLWAAITGTLQSLMSMDAVSELVKNNLIDYVLSLLIQLHPHNYSGVLVGSQALSREQVSRAKQFLIEQADLAIGSQDIAAYMDCSIGALNHSFLHFEGLTPRQLLYRERLKLARNELANGPGSLPDEAWIRARGFANTNGFRQHYQQRYGELPEHTHAGATGIDPAHRRGRALGRRVLSVERVQSLASHIRQTLSEKITLQGLASQAGVSKQALIAAFSHHLGMTPLQYVIAERMKLAKHCLESSQQSLVTIAVDAGFYSQSHMTTTFKNEIGMSPGQYRKRVQAAQDK